MRESLAPSWRELLYVSQSYFLQPPDDSLMRYYIIITTGWAFSPSAFLGRLRLRWPLVRSEEPSVSRLNTFQDFEFPMEHSVLYGSIDHSGKGVTIDSGALDDCAEFACWCRTLIPPSEKVVFFHDSMAIDFILDPDMTPEEIVQAMSASGN